jgi:hypothetical protein
MNRLLEMLRGSQSEKYRHSESKSSRPTAGSGRSSNRRRGRRRTSNRDTHHFYDPNRPDEVRSSSEGIGPSDIEQEQTDTMTRIEEAEAALAKERKRIEQLEHRRQEIEAREGQRRAQQDQYSGLSPREKNRKAYETEVARVERKALRKIEELDRRFAHSDKLFELSHAKQNPDLAAGQTEASENPQTNYQYEREKYHQADYNSRHDAESGPTRAQQRWRQPPAAGQQRRAVERD